MFGDAASRITLANLDEGIDDLKGVELNSYLAGAGAGMHDRQRFAAALDDLLPWLGEAVGRPVAALLARVGAHSATVIICGPFGSMPLHAASWRTTAGEVALIDIAEIRYAPSAASVAVSIQRAKVRDNGLLHLVAAANPKAIFPPRAPRWPTSRVTSAGQRSPQTATPRVGSIRRAATRATHLHLACHAHADFATPEEAVVALADGSLSAGEFAAIGPLQSRLAVLSTCRSNIPVLGAQPDEVFSIATTALIAGSACAIASLWQVDDLATAMLMIRHDDALAEGVAPRGGAAHCSTRLRDLTLAEERASCVNTVAARRSELRRRGRGARDEDDADRAHDIRRYQLPAFWAAFVATGA